MTTRAKLYETVVKAAPRIDWGAFTPENEAAVAEFIHAAHLAMDDAQSEDRAAVKTLLRVYKTWLARCEDELHPKLKVRPVELLRLLIEQHGLSRADLVPQLGPASTVSDILNGNRAINSRQAQLLAERFAMHTDAFLEPAQPYAAAARPVEHGGTVGLALAAASSYVLGAPGADHIEIALGCMSYATTIIDDAKCGRPMTRLTRAGIDGPEEMTL